MKMEKLHESRNLDLTGAARGVWLVKVPKYLADKWHQTRGDVGKLRINRPKVAGGKPEVLFTLSDSLSNSDDPEETPTPKDHKFVMNGIKGHNLSVLSRETVLSATGEPLPENVAVEGKVIQRAECRPIADSRYMNLKKNQMEQVTKPQRTVVQLDKIVQNYKPVTQHHNEVEYLRKKKEEGKRSRLDRDKVQDLLFAAFEKHQYYNVKDLVKITQQPITYLKEILKDICVYNMKTPHRNMWELKPEYRHYKSQEGDT